MEVGDGVIQLPERAIGNGALVEVLRCALGFYVSGELFDVMFRALVGIDR